MNNEFKDFLDKKQKNLFSINDEHKAILKLGDSHIVESIPYLLSRLKDNDIHWIIRVCC